jgi:hypothetical protein
MNRKMVHFHLPTPGQDSLAVDIDHLSTALPILMQAATLDVVGP